MYSPCFFIFCILWHFDTLKILPPLLRVANFQRQKRPQPGVGLSWSEEKVTQLCPPLCDPVDCSLLGPSVHGDSPGKNTGVGCQALLQRIFPTQESNPGLPHCRQILYCLSHQFCELLAIWGGGYGNPWLINWLVRNTGDNLGLLFISFFFFLRKKGTFNLCLNWGWQSCGAESLTSSGWVSSR